MFEYSEIREGFKVKLFLPIINQWQAPAELGNHEQFSLQDDTWGSFILLMPLYGFYTEKKINRIMFWNINDFKSYTLYAFWFLT